MLPSMDGVELVGSLEVDFETTKKVNNKALERVQAEFFSEISDVFLNN